MTNSKLWYIETMEFSSFLLAWFHNEHNSGILKRLMGDAKGLVAKDAGALRTREWLWYWQSLLSAVATRYELWSVWSGEV